MHLIKRYINDLIEKSGTGSISGYTGGFWMPKQPDKDYIKYHLLEYAKFQIGQGYELSDIRQVLVNYGYHSQLVDEVLYMINPGDYLVRKPLEHKDLRQMDKNLYFYIRNMLIDYIMKEQEQGYSIKTIRNALINCGHHPHMVDEAIKTIENGDAVDYGSVRLIQINPQILFALSIFAFFMFVVFLSISTNESITLVLYSFSPAVLALFLVYFASLVVRNQALRRFLPLFGVVVAVGAFVLAAQLSSSIPRLPGTTIILVLNLVISFLLGCAISFFSRVGDEEILERAKKAKTKKLELEPKNEPVFWETHRKVAEERKGAKVQDLQNVSAVKKHKVMYHQQVPDVKGEPRGSEADDAPKPPPRKVFSKHGDMY
jgi:hypothetical protein